VLAVLFPALLVPLPTAVVHRVSVTASLVGVDSGSGLLPAARARQVSHEEAIAARRVPTHPPIRLRGAAIEALLLRRFEIRRAAAVSRLSSLVQVAVGVAHNVGMRSLVAVPIGVAHDVGMRSLVAVRVGMRPAPLPRSSVSCQDDVVRSTRMPHPMRAPVVIEVTA
jgi:hypothetical protein